MSAINGFQSNFSPQGKILLPTNSTQSSFRAPGNALADNSNTLIDSLHYNEQKIPSIQVNDAVSALRVLDAMSYLTSLTQRMQSPIDLNLDKKLGNSQLQTNTLIGIRESLKTLSANVSSLLGGDALNTRSAKSSWPNLIGVTAGNGSRLASATVVPKQVSAGNVLVSNEQPSTHPALGLTGSFNINGYGIAVVPSDTIDTLKDKINHGEDLNHNGTLDGSEDINGTGQPGVIFLHAGEYTPGVYIVKDQNGKGSLSPAEDANDNARLDGGTKDTKVVATVENNRLKLTSLTGGANTIDLQDTNNILLSLGFFERDRKGIMPIQKEVQYTNVTTVLPPPTDLMVSPRKAEINVDGKTVGSDTNVFDGVVGSAELTVKKASHFQVQISISLDPTNAIDRIKTFFNNFNDVIGKINNALAATKTFETDTDIQLLRNELTRTQSQILQATQSNAGIDVNGTNLGNRQTVGFKINSDKSTLQETAVTNQVQSIKDQLAMPIQSTPVILQKRLSSIGIQSAADSTFSLDEAGLKRALTANTDGVLNLFTDPQTGILPQLKNQLSSILEKGIGRIDYKASKIEGLSNVPLSLNQKYQKYAEVSTLGAKVQTLIAVA